MAKRSTPVPPASIKMAADDMRRGITRLESRITEVEAFDPKSITDTDAPEVTTLHTSVEEALVRTFGHGTPEYHRYSDASYFSTGPINLLRATPIWQVQEALEKSRQNSIALLKQAVRSLKEQLEEQVGMSAPSTPPEEALPKDSKRIFIVHGHDNEAKQTVARFIGNLGLTPIILHEQASSGRTIIEKLEAYSDVGFAIVLLTPDDEGRAKGAPDLKPRARQNVVAELGYFIGHLGRDKVCPLAKSGVEVPSDFDGVVYVPFEATSNHWKVELAKELRAAKYDLKMEALIG